MGMPSCSLNVPFWEYCVGINSNLHAVLHLGDCVAYISSCYACTSLRFYLLLPVLLCGTGVRVGQIRNKIRGACEGV